MRSQYNDAYTLWCEHSLNSQQVLSSIGKNESAMVILGRPVIQLKEWTAVQCNAYCERTCCLVLWYLITKWNEKDRNCPRLKHWYGLAFPFGSTGICSWFPFLAFAYSFLNIYFPVPLPLCYPLTDSPTSGWEGNMKRSLKRYGHYECD
jgi:hypothetical protein